MSPLLSTWSLNGKSLELPAEITREQAQAAGDPAILTAFTIETIRQNAFTVAISIVKNTKVRPLPGPSTHPLRNYLPPPW
jgi:hypothetical protein